MSFQSISCTMCDLYFSNIPKIGHVDENGTPRILTYPNGTRALNDEILARLPDNFFLMKEFWSLEEYFCLRCYTKSELVSGEERVCLQCKSPDIKTGNEIMDQKCPACGVGHVRLNPPTGIVF